MLAISRGNVQSMGQGNARDDGIISNGYPPCQQPTRDLGGFHGVLPRYMKDFYPGESLGELFYEMRSFLVLLNTIRSEHRLVNGDGCGR